jgi:hypothetical protein
MIFRFPCSQISANTVILYDIFTSAVASFQLVNATFASDFQISIDTMASNEFIRAALKGQLEKQCGREITIPSDCQIVADCIWEKLHEHVSINTVKRLLGFLPYEKTHRLSTLNIIARYLGFQDWQMLTKTLASTNSDFETNSESILSADLHKDDMVRFTYHPDRKLVIAYRGNGEFLVKESENSKLLAGDIIRLSALTLHYPLLVTDVVRNGESLGEFTAGKIGGITSIEKVKR